MEIESAFGSPTLELAQPNGPKNRLSLPNAVRRNFQSANLAPFGHGARRESADEFR
jgi:hypothetical protein